MWYKRNSVRNLFNYVSRSRNWVAFWFSISRPNVPNRKLPTFWENYTEYTDLMSMFSTVIDKNPTRADMEKLQHLKSSLRGPALDAVVHFTTWAPLWKFSSVFSFIVFSKTSTVKPSYYGRMLLSASADVFRSAFQLMYNQLINKSQNQQN